MKIIFNQLQIENFMSFKDATISLDNNGYVSIYGQNNNVNDFAESNGSGKSSIWEALFWCLTGTTIRGAKDVVNHFVDDGCFVRLMFNIDNDEYEIIRSKDHSKYKTNLKIFINSQDKSGKGIRDSEKLLSEYLPDLTAQLLSSVIVLGQGLPQRFTNNTPAGRKEVLEKLSKSDFMIDDLKNRLSSRSSELSKQLRDKEDARLTNTTKRDIAENVIRESQQNLNNLISVKDLEAEIDNLNAQLKVEKAAFDKVCSDIKESSISYEEANKNWNDVRDARLYLVAEERKAESAAEKMYDEERLQANNEVAIIQNIINSIPEPVATDVYSKESAEAALNEIKINLDNIPSREKAILDEVEFIEGQIKANRAVREDVQRDIQNAFSEYERKRNELSPLTEEINRVKIAHSSLQKEIESLKNVKDTCPTCGQKLPDVHVIDTSEKEKELSILFDKITNLSYNYKCKESEITQDYSDKKVLNESKMSQVKLDESNLEASRFAKTSELNSLSTEKLNYNKRAASLNKFLKRVDLSDAQKKVAAVTHKIEEAVNNVKTKYAPKMMEYEESERLFAETRALCNKNKDALINLRDAKTAIIDQINSKILDTKFRIEKYNSDKANLEFTLETQTKIIEDLNQSLLYINSEIELIKSRQEVTKKFETVIKRDFRGYLLTSCIDFINAKAKMYCNDIFETSSIEFKLDGNNISISYLGKEYESLSGGEKQKIDLIVQFSLRDMLCTFLNFSSNILVLDEITDNLDALGCQKVINFISKRLSDVNSIYIISHRKDLDIPYDKQLLVEKNSDGISTVNEFAYN